MKGEGPYRESGNPSAGAIEKMEKEIAAEGKFSIQLPEKIKYGEAVPFFEDALKNNIDPKDIIFYSLATGIVKYNNVTTIIEGHFSLRQFKAYVYKNQSDPYIELKIEVENNKATFVSITTKGDSEKIKKEKEKRDWYYATNNLKANIEKIKKMISSGVNPELDDDLKNNAESLLRAITDGLKKKK